AVPEPAPYRAAWSLTGMCRSTSPLNAIVTGSGGGVGSVVVVVPGGSVPSVDWSVPAVDGAALVGSDDVAPGTVVEPVAPASPSSEHAGAVARTTSATAHASARRSP